MKEITAYCDVAWLEHREKVLARDVGVELRLGDEAVELDLSEQGRKELRGLLARYLDAGTPAPPARKRGGRRQVDPGSAAEKKALREFGDRFGYSYKTALGSWSYPTVLKDGHAAWVREGRPDAWPDQEEWSARTGIEIPPGHRRPGVTDGAPPARAQEGSTGGAPQDGVSSEQEEGSGGTLI